MTLTCQLAQAYHDNPTALHLRAMDTLLTHRPLLVPVGPLEAGVPHLFAGR